MKSKLLIPGSVLAIVVLSAAAWLIFGSSHSRFGISSRPREGRDTVLVGSFNVGELFDSQDDPALSGDFDDQPSSQAHLQVIAQAIRKLDADILALEGVESQEALEWFVSTYLGDMGYDHILSLDVGHPRGIENGIISRFPVQAGKVWPDAKLKGKHPKTIAGKANKYAGKSLRFRRSPLMVQVELPGTDTDKKHLLTIFVIEHKGGDKYAYWRKAEALGVIRLAREVGMSQPMMIVGSFHDDPKSEVIDLYNKAGFTDVFGVSGETARWATERSGDRTDFLLVNPMGRSLVVPGSGFVLGGKLAELDDDPSHLPLAVGIRIGDE